jgi:hypothetical protein
MLLLSFAIIGGVFFVLFLMRRGQAAHPGDGAEWPAGTTVFALKAIDLRCGGLANMRFRNSISPVLAIDATALYFRAMGARRLAFEAIQRVEFHTFLGFTALLFIGQAWGYRLRIAVPDTDTARAILRALPANLAMSPEAATLRGKVESLPPRP